MYPLETAKEGSSMSVYLRVRPPRAMDGDVDEETGLRTIEIIREKECERDNLHKGRCGRVSLGGGEEDGALECVPARSVLAIPPSCSPEGSTGPINEKKEGSLREFVFTEVFPPEASQEYVYEASTRPLIDDIFLGHDGLLFVYGLTNAGKSFTAFGTKPNPGILPRVLTDIFERIEDIDSVCYESDVVLSFFEIDNENINDLLDLSGKSKDDREPVELQDQGDGMMWPRNLTRTVVHTAEESLELIKAAKANRQGISTKISQRSCRKHSICAINFCPLGFKDDLQKQGSLLWVVDLAGHENCKRDGMKNALGSTEIKLSSSDKSLNTLWQCLNMIHFKKSGSSENCCNSSSIPFQESKLTQFFEGHLSGTNTGNKTVMVVNINPSVPHFNDTYQVLRNSAITQRMQPVHNVKPVRRQLGFLDINRRYNGRCFMRRKSRVGSQREKAGMELSKVTPLKADSAYGLMALNGLNTLDSHRETPKGDDQGGNVSGAESDGALEDRRHSLALVMEDLEARNERLRKHLTAVKIQAARDIEKLKDYYEERLVEQRRALSHRVKELEAEFDDFLEENNLDPAETATTCSSFSSTYDPDSPSHEYELQAEITRLRDELDSIRNNFNGSSLRQESGRKSSCRSSFKGGHPLSGSGMKTISPSSDLPGDLQVEHKIGEMPTTSERLGVSVPHLRDSSIKSEVSLQNHQPPPYQHSPVKFHEKMVTPEKITNPNIEQTEQRSFWRSFFCMPTKSKKSSRKPPAQPTNVSPV